MSQRAIPHLIPPEMVPINGLNPLFHCVSGARQVMFTGNLSQMLVIDGRTRKRIQSGLEQQHAQATFCHKFPRDAVVLAVIPRFSSLMWGESFNINPMDLVIYEDWETHQLDVMELTRFHVMHQHYGFEFEFDPEIYNRLTMKNARFEKGTVIARSPNVTDDGDYMYGLEANVIAMSAPEGIEDGIGFSRSFSERATTTAFETRTFTCGRSHYPINTYGNGEIYKVVPDIGETIHSNGLLCALRPWHKYMDAINMSQRNLLRPIYGLDTTHYGYSEAEVVDIRVRRNDRLPHRRLPDEMTAQLRKYHEADKRFYIELIRACSTRNGKLLNYQPAMSEHLTMLLDHAVRHVGPDLIKEGLWPKHDIASLEARMNYRGELMDEFRVDVTYRYKASIAEGGKLSDLAGGKGVGTRLIEDEDMPIDKFGNRADIIYYSGSTVNRMNPGRNHEQMIGAAGRDVIKRIRRSYNLPDVGPIDHKVIVDAVRGNDKLFKKNFNYVKGFYEKLSPTALYPLVNKPEFEASGRAHNHLIAVIKDGDVPHGMYLRMPSDSGLLMDEIMDWLEDSEYTPEISEVTYRDLSGKVVTTKHPILIGPNYYTVSEKTATDGSGISSGRTNQFGTASRLTNADKHSAPARETVTRADGESEARNKAASHGAEFMAEQFDMHNNPTMHKVATMALLTADKPTNIPRILDRSIYKLGGHRPLAFMKQMLLVSGKQLTTRLRPKTKESEAEREAIQAVPLAKSRRKTDSLPAAGGLSDGIMSIIENDGEIEGVGMNEEV